MIPPPQTAASRAGRAFTLTETSLVLVCLVVVLAVMVPAVGQLRRTAPVLESTYNLQVLHQTLVCYAADWNDRQYTAVPDDLGVVGGSCAAYVYQFGCYPPAIAGWDCDGVGPWAFWGGGCFGGSGLTACPANNLATRPINFNPDLAFGIFRFPQVKPIHDYLGGKFYDRRYYSSLDHQLVMAALPAFDQDCEFDSSVGTIPSTYAWSPAAMYHPQVFRAPSQGGFQHPDTFDDGYRSPAVSQARFPALKTWLIEHNWLVEPPPDCNVDCFPSQCIPYIFNHGTDAEPVVLFFDGSIRSLRTGDVVADDAKVLKQTGGVDGLWSRDTPFGPTGYFGDCSFDGTIVSHHVLTTGGILGRDTLGR